METITSRENAKIKYACAVRDSEKQRAADGLFFAEGPKLCLELAKSCTPRAMYATAAALAACIMRGRPLEETARLAVGAGALACTSEKTIHPGMSWENINYILNKEEQ